LLISREILWKEGANNLKTQPSGEKREVGSQRIEAEFAGGLYCKRIQGQIC
jgi:hypothetical protein